jgi:hypothetical protein
MYRAYTGDESPRAWRNAHSRGWPDRVLERVLGRTVEPDSAAAWWSETGKQARVRTVMILGALLAAVTAGVLIGAGHVLLALPVILLAAVLDIVDGAFARVVHMRDAHLRWFSCIGSHAGDMCLIGGIAFSAEYGPIGTGQGAWLLAAAVVTLFGSLVRTSALQAAYRFWRSALERYLRYGAVLACLGLVLLGFEDAAIMLLAGALGVFGLLETLRVLVGVKRMPAAQDGGIVFVDVDRGVHTIAISDDGDAWGTLDDREDQHTLTATST